MNKKILNLAGIALAVGALAISYKAVFQNREEVRQVFDVKYQGYRTAYDLIGTPYNEMVFDNETLKERGSRKPYFVVEESLEELKIGKLYRVTCVGEGMHRRIASVEPIPDRVADEIQNDVEMKRLEQRYGPDSPARKK